MKSINACEISTEQPLFIERTRRSLYNSVTGNIAVLAFGAVLATGCSVKSPDKAAPAATSVAPAAPAPAATEAAPAAAAPQIFPEWLKPSARSDAVGAMEDDLIKVGCLNVIKDNFYGESDKAAVRTFQQSKGIPSGGDFGPLTQPAMQAALSRVPIDTYCGWNTPHDMVPIVVSKASSITKNSPSGPAASYGVPLTNPNQLDRNLLNPDGSRAAPYGPISTAAPNQLLVCNNLPPGMRLECNSQLPPKP